MKQRWFAKHNLKSADRRTARNRRRIEKDLDNAGISYEFEVSAHAGHATLMRKKAASSRYRK
jgi:diacylglycerol kinase family enzyme